MWSVHRRIAQLWYIHSNTRELTKNENTELKIALDAHMNEAWKLAKLENESYVASAIGDTEWQHEVCKKIDKINNKMIDQPS